MLAMNNPRIEFSGSAKLNMSALESRIRDWGETQPGLLSFKVARTDLKPECRVALDVIDESARASVHQSFCELESELLPHIDFDLEWMTFAIDEYPLQRRAFFSDCRHPSEQHSGETLVPGTAHGFFVFDQRVFLDTAVFKKWLHLVRGE